MKSSPPPRWLEDAGEPSKRLLRQALDEAPRFAPSDVRRRRVWARVDRPHRTDQSTLRAFVLGALVSAGVGVVAMVSYDRLRSPFVGANVGANGHQSHGANGPVAVAGAHRPLAPDNARVEETEIQREIRTASGERITRQLEGDAEAELRPNSVLFLGDGSAAALEIRAGQIAFKVARQPLGRHFEVRAGAFRVVVVGTRFIVGVEDRDVTVSVSEGVVEIWGSERLVRLARGQTWTSAGGGGDTRPSPRAVTAALETNGPGRHQTPPAAALRPIPPDPDGGPELTAARSARAAADPKRALALYQHLSERGGPLGENALYEIGAIYRDELHEPRRALAAWERYRSRYPGGLLRAEADLSIVDTLSGLGEGTRALGEALAFLRRYPRSERRGEIARVAADLYRSRGNCQEAAALYSKVEGTGVSASDVDDAAFGRAACLSVIHDPGADSALRSYLHDRPTGRHRAEVARLLAEPDTNQR